MASTLATYTGNQVSVQYKEPLMTKAFNEKGTANTAPGIYRGFTIAGAAGGITLVRDTATLDSVAVTETVNGDSRYSLTLRLTDDVPVSLTSFVGQEVVLALYGAYTTTAPTTIELRVYTVAQYDAATEKPYLTVIGTIRVPVLGVLNAWNTTNSAWDGATGSTGYTAFRRTTPALSTAIGALPWHDAIRNGRFDQADSNARTDTQYVADYWKLDEIGGDLDLFKVVTEAVTAKRILVLYTDANATVSGSASQWLNLPVVPGEQIKLSADVAVLATPISGSFSFFIEWADVDITAASVTTTSIPIDLSATSASKSLSLYSNAALTYRVPDTYVVPAGMYKIRRVGITATSLVFGAAAANRLSVSDFQLLLESRDPKHLQRGKEVRADLVAGPIQLIDPEAKYDDATFAGTTGYKGARIAYDTDNNRVVATAKYGGVTTIKADKLISDSAPTAATEVTNKTYVDTLMQNGASHTIVKLATAAALPACSYSNGTLGAGATLTGSVNGVLTVDGTALTANDATYGTRVLVKNEVDTTHNGPYTVTNPGSAGAQFILTRAVDAVNEGAGYSGLRGGYRASVATGTANAGTIWTMATPTSIYSTVGAPFYAVFGTTGNTWTLSGLSGVINAGDGLEITGTGAATTIAMSGTVPIECTFNSATQFQARFVRGGNTCGNITVGTYSALSENQSSQGTFLFNNVYLDTTDGTTFRYRNTNATYGHAGIQLKGGIIYFYTESASVTADAVTTLVERVRINEEGNVGIGLGNTATNNCRLTLSDDATQSSALPAGTLLQLSNVSTNTPSIGFHANFQDGILRYICTAATNEDQRLAWLSGVGEVFSVNNIGEVICADPTAATHAATRGWVEAQGYGTGSGDITAVIAGSGLTGGAASGDATLTVGAGGGITVNADDVALANSANLINNYIAYGTLGGVNAHSSVVFQTAPYGIAITAPAGEGANLSLSNDGVVGNLQISIANASPNVTLSSTTAAGAMYFQTNTTNRIAIDRYGHLFSLTAGTPICTFSGSGWLVNPTVTGNDVRGTVVGQKDASGASTFTITYDDGYGTVPIVMLSYSNATNDSYSCILSASSATAFTVSLFSTAGNEVINVNYLVIG